MKTLYQKSVDWGQVGMNYNEKFKSFCRHPHLSVHFHLMNGANDLYTRRYSPFFHSRAFRALSPTAISINFCAHEIRPNRWKQYFLMAHKRGRERESRWKGMEKKWAIRLQISPMVAIQKFYAAEFDAIRSTFTQRTAVQNFLLIY